MGEPEDKRENGARAFGTLLNTRLERLGELRKVAPERPIPQELARVTPLPRRKAPAIREPKAKPEEIIAELAKLDVIFPTNLAVEERSLRYRVFCDDLGHLPRWKVERACRLYRYNPENRFFPSPGQLLELTK